MDPIALKRLNHRVRGSNARIRGCTFEVVRNGGHGFNAEENRRLKPIVEAFLDKHLKSAATPR